MDLLTYLEVEGIPYEQHEHPASFTAQGLAQAEHVPGRNVAKPVLVKGEQGFTLCVVPAPAHVDLDAVAEALGERQVELAHEHELVGLFPGCELGAEPPVGTLYGLSTLADYTLLDDDYVEFQAGTHTRSVRITRVDFERIADPRYARICLSRPASA